MSVKEEVVMLAAAGLSLAGSYYLASDVFLPMMATLAGFIILGLAGKLLTGRFTMAEAKATAYSVLIANLLAIITIIVLAAFLFNNKSYSLIALIWAFFIPSIAVYNIASIAMHEAISRGEVRVFRVTAHACATTLILGVLLTAGAAAATHYLYSSQYASYAENYQQLHSQLEAATRKIPESTLPVVKEVKQYGSGALAEAEAKNTEFTKYAQQNPLCISGKCIETIAGQLDQQLEMSLQAQLLDALALNAEDNIKAAGETEPGQAAQQISAMKAKLQLTGYKPGQSDTDSLDTASYETIAKLRKKYPLAEESPVAGLTSLLPPGTSALTKSITTAVLHTGIMKEVLVIDLKMKIYQATWTKNNDLITMLYRNRDIKESEPSKLLRYTIMLAMLDSKPGPRAQ